MNYPHWLLEGLGGGNLIAIIAGVHVYISHLAVGGGLFLWLLDRYAYKHNDTLINGFLRRYNWVFLLVTFVLGSMTGVGIWFAIGLVSPEATSSLIHTFVFGWAIEWVFFVAEIVSLLVYHYFFDRLERKVRLTMAFLYFLFAWLSLVIINGILAYMLTPGAWLETGGFWHGFFNPSYFPSLLFRSFAAVMMAGLFAFVVGSFQGDEAVRRRISRIGVKWLLVAFAGMIPTGLWYYFSVPEPVREVNFELNGLMDQWVWAFFVTAGLLLVLGLLHALRAQPLYQRILAVAIIPIGLLWIASFEFVREISRKPFLIHSHLYSNSVYVDDVQEVNEKGYLATAKWVRHKSITDENRMDVGRDLFELQCLPCHTVGGRNDVAELTKEFTYMGNLALLNGQGRSRKYMPPFFGTDAEQEALASYITAELHGKEIEKSPDSYTPPEKGVEPHSYDAREGGYVLLAWNDLGMHCISDCSPWFVILPPANTLEAQLIRRGDPPQVVADGVELTYTAPEGFRDPAAHVPFWDHAETLYGADLEPNVGLGGKGMSGSFDRVEGEAEFVAPMIPIVPYSDDGSFDPFPAFTVEARDVSSGDLLAATRAVAPTSTEMGCRNCHGGPWRTETGAGVSDETARNILATHDRLSDTDLLAQARAGKPQPCQNCHADPAVGMEGKPELLNLSSALHGFHAAYMHVEGSDACVMCHPAYETGYTRCQRGVHSLVGMGCADCHGNLEEHALSLLKHEMEAGKEGAARLAEPLEPEQVASIEEVNPRMPWVNEPDCLNCHEDFQAPTSFSGYNEWTEGAEELYRTRLDHADAVRCEACHGSPHALYPAVNPFDTMRDNLQPLQYQGDPLPIGSEMQCTVCHEVMHDYMRDFSVHHDNMVRPFRNSALVPEQ